MKGRVHPAQLASLSQHPTDSKPLLFSLQYFSVFSPSHRDPAAFPIKGKNLRLLHLPTCFLLFTPASLLVLFLGSCIGSYSCISAVKVGKKAQQITIVLLVDIQVEGSSFLYNRGANKAEQRRLSRWSERRFWANLNQVFAFFYGSSHAHLWSPFVYVENYQSLFKCRLMPRAFEKPCTLMCMKWQKMKKQNLKGK